jgi:hypothetical protein
MVGAYPGWRPPRRSCAAGWGATRKAARENIAPRSLQAGMNRLCPVFTTRDACARARPRLRAKEEQRAQEERRAAAQKETIKQYAYKRFT